MCVWSMKNEDEGGDRWIEGGVELNQKEESHMRERVYKESKAREAHKDINVIEW